MIERANKQILSYQKQLARQKQKRAEAVLKKQGRPFSSQESKERAIQLIIQLNELNVISLNST